MSTHPTADPSNSSMLPDELSADAYGRLIGSLYSEFECETGRPSTRTVPYISIQAASIAKNRLKYHFVSSYGKGRPLDPQEPSSVKSAQTALVSAVRSTVAEGQLKDYVITEASHVDAAGADFKCLTEIMKEEISKVTESNHADGHRTEEGTRKMTPPPQGSESATEITDFLVDCSKFLYDKTKTAGTCLATNTGHGQTVLTTELFSDASLRDLPNARYSLLSLYGEMFAEHMPSDLDPWKFLGDRRSLWRNEQAASTLFVQLGRRAIDTDLFRSELRPKGGSDETATGQLILSVYKAQQSNPLDVELGVEKALRSLEAD